MAPLSLSMSHFTISAYRDTIVEYIRDDIESDSVFLDVVLSVSNFNKRMLEYEIAYNRKIYFAKKRLQKNGLKRSRGVLNIVSSKNGHVELWTSFKITSCFICDVTEILDFDLDNFQHCRQLGFVNFSQKNSVKTLAKQTEKNENKLVFFETVFSMSVLPPDNVSHYITRFFIFVEFHVFTVYYNDC